MSFDCDRQPKIQRQQSQSCSFDARRARRERSCRHESSTCQLAGTPYFSDTTTILFSRDASTNLPHSCRQCLQAMCRGEPKQQANRDRTTSVRFRCQTQQHQSQLQDQQASHGPKTHQSMSNSQSMFMKKKKQ